jgi:predicted nucleotidyltransferase
MMSSGAACLDPYPEVRQLLDDVLRSVQPILGERFVGMYLYGSLAIGGFDLRTSDIDFLVVAAEEPRPEVVAALCALHARLSAGGSHWARELEGSYIPVPDIRHHDPQHAVHLHLERGEGQLTFERHDSDWVIHRHVLWEQGVVLAGPPACELIDPVSPADMRRALLDLMRGWWTPMIEDPSRLYPLGYRCYAIQTMCRVLYTLKFNTIVPKPVAAQWARAELGSRWSPLIDWSFSWPRVEQPDSLTETRELIRCVSEHCKLIEAPADR